jgi:predicted NACHT family NTPase
VAEATGLLAINPQNLVEAEDIITFMHYSFLEYYAAAGLLARDYSKSLSDISGIPRWKDVTTLLFGILSEQGDVTPALQVILTDKTPTDVISKHKLLLALECASECDVWRAV